MRRTHSRYLKEEDCPVTTHQAGSARLEDRRGHGFYIIDNAVIEEYGPQIGAYGLAVYNVLAMYAGRKGSAFPSLRAIERMLGISRPTVIKAIDTLVEVGLITRSARRTGQGDRTSNIYTLVLVGGKEGLPPGQSDLPRVVNDIDHGGQSDLPPVVNDIDHRGKGDLPDQYLMNNTHIEQDPGRQESSEGSPAPPGQPALPAAAEASVQPEEEQVADPKEHPLVAAYREWHRRWPTHAQMRMIIESNPPLQQWHEAMRAWSGKGYKPTNIQGQLEWAHNPSLAGLGGLPKKSGPVSKVQQSLDAVDSFFSRLELKGGTV